MKILVVFTGGTIGSIETEDSVITLNREDVYSLIKRYKEIEGDKIRFDTLNPYTVHSEHLSANELNLLVGTICDNVDKNYDGIIVTHGTDTLQYSASAIAYAVGTDTIPIVFVSSNYPLDTDGSNGLINFSAAVEFIKREAGRGVFVSYKNERNDVVYIHRGSRVTIHQEACDSLHSLDSKPYAYYQDGMIWFPFIKEGRLPHNPVGRFTLIDEPGILVVHPFPGASYEYGELKGLKAIILSPYHSATLDTVNEKFRVFCHKAYEAGVPVYVIHCKDGAVYQSATRYEELHIKKLRFSTLVSAYMKLWIASSIDVDRDEFLDTEICGEWLK